MTNAKTPCYLYNLPNELLLHILNPIPTPQLLPLTVLSHRIYTVILRILHNRLLLATALNEHNVLLECYHPAARLTQESYLCSYRGTDGLDTYIEPSQNDSTIAGRLGEMRNLYSRFRPHKKDAEQRSRRPRKHPAGDVPGSRTYQASSSSRQLDQDELVKQTLGLDGHELFTQLCAVSSIIRYSNRSTIPTHFVDIEDGVVRVWRDWLRNNAQKQDSAATGPVEEFSKLPVKRVDEAQADLNDNRILWVSPKRDTGLRLNVRERKFRIYAPILIEANEDTPVSYELEFDELVVRTTALLLTFERLLMQDDNTSGKAIVFGSFG